MPVNIKCQAVFFFFFCRKDISKAVTTLRSLRHNSQQDVVKSNGVQGNDICTFCVFEHMCMRVCLCQKVCALCALILCKYSCYIYILFEQFAKFYSTVSWFLNDKYLLGGWQCLCQVSVEIARCNIWVKEPWKMKHILENKEGKKLAFAVLPGEYLNSWF